MEIGIDIWVCDEQPKNVKYEIEVTEEGIVICVNDEQPEKALSPIEVTDEGISNMICANDKQLSKT